MSRPDLPTLTANAAPSALPPSIDPVAAARWQAMTPAQTPWLHDEVARRMEQRLDWMTCQPTAWAHWEPLRGSLPVHEKLIQRYPKAGCFVVQSQPGQALAAAEKLIKPWWHPARWQRQAPQFGLPPPNGVQMLWANMALHMAADPRGLILQWHAALASEGFLMFSCFGPDTLRELRILYRSMGWTEPAHAFTDMHDWGDMLVEAGFAQPVMDMERIVLTFATPERLLAELRELGRNLNGRRFAALRGRQWLAQLHQGLAQTLALPAAAGSLSLTFEIIYGHAFKPAPRMALQAQSVIALQDMRNMLRPRPNNRD